MVFLTYCIRFDFSDNLTNDNIYTGCDQTDQHKYETNPTKGFLKILYCRYAAQC